MGPIVTVGLGLSEPRSAQQISGRGAIDLSGQLYLLAAQQLSTDVNVT